MQPSTSPLVQALLERAWAQWIALGVDATGQGDVAVVDPEALIVLTAELGDADARLRDLSTDWCVAFGRYVNGARLKQVARELDTPIDAIGEYVATVAAAGGPTWPLATRSRADHIPRSRARLVSADSMARLRIRLRAAFGVNARADILAALLAASPGALSAADLARQTRFTKPNVAFALAALGLAGVVVSRAVGNERRYALPPGVPLLPGLRPPVPQADWVLRYGVALAAQRLTERAAGPTAVRAIEARRLIAPRADAMAAEGIPVPDLDVTGAAFAAEFDGWLLDLAGWLRPGTAG